MEKTTLEKFLRESITKNETLLNKPMRSNSFSEYSPMTKKLLMKHAHATPTTPKTQHNTNTNTVDSPFTRLSKTNKILVEKIRNPVTPLKDSPGMFTSTKCRHGSNDGSPVFNADDATASSPMLTTVVVADLDRFQGSQNGTPKSDMSPPTLYVIDRTGDGKSGDGRELSPQNSARGSDSGEDLAIKLHYMAANTDTNESLQEELSKVGLFLGSIFVGLGLLLSIIFFLKLTISCL